MTDCLGTKKVKISKATLKRTNFSKMSPISREMLQRSPAFYKAALLSKSKPKYAKAAYYLAKKFFDITG